MLTYKTIGGNVLTFPPLTLNKFVSGLLLLTRFVPVRLLHLTIISSPIYSLSISNKTLSNVCNNKEN